LLINILLGLSIFLFVISILLPKDVLAAFPRRIAPRHDVLLVIAIVFLLFKSVLLLQRHQDLNLFLEMMPFVLLFLLILNRYSAFDRYTFGADDAYYYSYLGSIVIDHDLDLSNQYSLSGLHEIASEKILERRTPAGYLVNVFPVGLSIFWLPFFLLGHLETYLLNLFGFSISMNGYTSPYLNSVVAGNLLYGIAGLFLIYKFVSRYFPRLMSFLVVVSIYLTTPLYIYFNGFYLVSEIVSVFLVAFLLFLVQQNENRLTAGKLFLIGILGGLAATVRFHNLVFLGLPALFVLIDFRNSWKEKGKAAFDIPALKLLSLSAGAIAGFVPQILIWRRMYGEWLVNLAGRFLPWWKHPFILETLFSTRKGLFLWSPLLLFAVIGLAFFIRKDRKWGWPFLFLLLLNVYINASQWDWWGSTAFGARRFLNCSIIFVTGFSAFWYALQQKWKWIGHVVTVILVLFLVHMNLFLSSAYWLRQIEYDHAQKFSEVFEGGLPSIYKAVVYPLELPVQLYYHWKYGSKAYGPFSELFIGDDIFYLQKKIPNFISSENPIFGKGWTQSNQEGAPVMITKEPTAIIYIPLFIKEKPKYLDVEINMQAADREEGLWGVFYLNDELFQKRRIPRQPGTISLKISRKFYVCKVNRLMMQIEREQPSTNKDPAVILRSIRFEGQSRRAQEADQDQE